MSIHYVCKQITLQNYACPTNHMLIHILLVKLYAAYVDRLMTSNSPLTCLDIGSLTGRQERQQPFKALVKRICTDVL